MLLELPNAKEFTKVDCSNGYWQVKLDDKSSTLTTVNTPFGRFKWKRMPFGIPLAREIFQQRLDQAIDGFDGVRTVADDISIIGNGETLQTAAADQDKNFLMPFERCRSKADQAELRQDRVKESIDAIHGPHIILRAGYSQPILEMTAPTDVARVRRILGTITWQSFSFTSPKYKRHPES